MRTATMKKARSTPRGTPPMRSRSVRASFVVLLLWLLSAWTSFAQVSGALNGQVLDPSGALVPDASVNLTRGATVFSTRSSALGRYQFDNVPLGSYRLSADSPGFTHYSVEGVQISQLTRLTIQLTISDREQMNVDSDGVGLGADQNGSATVLRGNDLIGLANDPTQLTTELQALAGPSAGPGGSQLYVDGFSGGQMPPLSSIREIRINQNPFASEFDSLGYGRIEILTKPGAQKLSGELAGSYLNSALNTAIPLSVTQPPYYSYWLDANASGPISKRASFFFDCFRAARENKTTYNAINPSNTAEFLSGTAANPDLLLYAEGRIDLQLTKSQTLSLRGFDYDESQSGGYGVGGLVLPQQSATYFNPARALQMSDTAILNPHMVMEINFEGKRSSQSNLADSPLPSISVQGAFTTGGNSVNTKNYSTNYELQNYYTVTEGKHIIRFGVRLRDALGAFTSTSGSNGSYYFQSLDQYLAGKPYLYTATVVNRATSQLNSFDAALFIQDEWRWRPTLNFSYGLRAEGQNHISDKVDWAPRLALSWSPSEKRGMLANTVLRGGAGIFYDRFTTDSYINGGGGIPYLIKVVQNNGVNQLNYAVPNPAFYDPSAPISPSVLASLRSSTPVIYTLDKHFHAASEFQSSLEIDRRLGKAMSLSVNYLYTRGIHQYLTNNISAANFDPVAYRLNGATPAEYNYQYRSGGTFKQHQLILTATSNYKKLSLHSSYTFNHADSNTTGAYYFPSVSQDPSLDYGRASFGITHQFQLLANYSAPFGLQVSPLLFARSGSPFNITLGSDLTGNNQSNARPTFGSCGAPEVMKTSYGCFDLDPVGKGERIIPFDYGTGPSNVVMNLRVTRKFGVGPRMAAEASPQSSTMTASMPGAGKSPSLPPRRYGLAFSVYAHNLFNTVNRAAPNGTLSSPLFGTSQTLAGGPFAPSSPGNRTIQIMSSFTF